MTCAAPLCATYTLRILDRSTGYTVAEFGVGDKWFAEATRRENFPSNILVTGSQDGETAIGECCSVFLREWCYLIELWRGDCKWGCWVYTGTNSEGAWLGVSLMALALLRPWSTTGTFTRSTTKMFELLLAEADRYSPLGIGLQPVPISVDVTVEAEKGEPLSMAFEQLQTGTLEWTEYFNTPYCSTVRFGEIAYDARHTLRAADWAEPVKRVATDGTLLASYVRVKSSVTETADDGTETTTDLVAHYPPADADGCPPRGSQKEWIPAYLEVEGLVDQNEADAVAKRAWEKRQNANFIETPDSGLSKRSKLCVCDLYPGAVFPANIDTVECGTVTEDFRLSEFKVLVTNGKETGAAPTLVGGQA